MNVSPITTTDEWLMFDDENVTAVETEDIMKLSGGGMRMSVSLSVSVCLCCLSSFTFHY